MASPAKAKQLDVVVIGGGLSGLTAAYNLTRKDPGLKVVVLEAKDRLGGRTLSKELKAANGKDVWDLGGQWVSSSQHHIMDLLNELGLETYQQFTDGTKLMQLEDDEIRSYQGSIPNIPLLASWELHRFINKIDKLSKEVSVSNPYLHPQSAELDSMTCETFKNKYLRRKQCRALLDTAFRVSFGCEQNRISLLHFLTYVNAAGGLLRLFEAGHGAAQELRVKGGTQQVSILLGQCIGKHRIHLKQPVSDILQDKAGKFAIIITSNGETFHASKVIMAIPLNEAVKINFEPALPQPRQVLLRSMPIGHLTKFIITYEQPFWREKGFSGEIVCNSNKCVNGEDTDMNPLSVVYDATTYDGNPALVGFLAGHYGIHWSTKTKSERKSAILTSVAKFFGKNALDPLDYMEQDWSQEPFNGGCPVNFITPGVMQYIAHHLRTPFGRIHWAGTDTATNWCGYLNGAVQAGLRASKEVLHDLSPTAVHEEDLRDTCYAKSEIQDFIKPPDNNVAFNLTIAVGIVAVLVIAARKAYFRMAI